MPLNAVLSRKLLDAFGEEVAEELVVWLNAMDQSYRGEFRDLFSANFGQVRAEMAQLRAELRGEMNELRAELRGEMNELRLELRSEMDQLRSELRSEMDQLRVELRGEMSELRVEMRSEMTKLRIELVADVDTKLEKLRTDLLKWMFLFWVGTMGIMLAITTL